MDRDDREWRDTEFWRQSELLKDNDRCHLHRSRRRVLSRAGRRKGDRDSRRTLSLNDGRDSGVHGGGPFPCMTGIYTTSHGTSNTPLKTAILRGPKHAFLCHPRASTGWDLNAGDMDQRVHAQRLLRPNVSVDDDVKEYLEKGITFVGSGVAHVRSTKLEITPQEVSWTENKRKYTAPGYWPAGCV